MKKLAIFFLTIILSLSVFTACAGPAADRCKPEKLMGLRGQTVEEVIKALGLRQNEYTLDVGESTDLLTIPDQQVWGCKHNVKLYFYEENGKKGFHTINYNSTEGMTHEEILDYMKKRIEEYDAAYGPPTFFPSSDNDQRKRLSSFASVEEWLSANGMILDDVWLTENKWGIRMSYEYTTPDDGHGSVFTSCSYIGDIDETLEEYLSHVYD